MRRLFLIRHAKAEPAVGKDDHERALTERGRTDAAAMARALRERGLLPQVLIHSGALRARETAEIFAEGWDGAVPLETDVRFYEAPSGLLFAAARALDDRWDRVALVGHNPGFCELAAALAGSGAQGDLRRMQSKYPTCAVAMLDFRVELWSGLHRHAAQLALYLTPEDLPAGAC